MICIGAGMAKSGPVQGGPWLVPRCQYEEGCRVSGAHQTSQDSSMFVQNLCQESIFIWPSLKCLKVLLCAS
jgi:hypothetical protein